MVANNDKGVLPSVDFVDAYKDRVRQLEIENKRMRCQLGLNQHRPIEGSVENDLNRVSVKLAQKTKKMKEVVAYAKSLEAKYSANKEESLKEIEEISEKNSSLEIELNKLRDEKENKENCFLYEIEELKKSLRKQGRELDSQKKRNISLEEKLKVRKQQLIEDFEKQMKSSNVCGDDQNNVMTTRSAKPSCVLAPLRGQQQQQAPDVPKHVLAPLAKIAPTATELRPAKSLAPLKRSLVVKSEDTISLKTESKLALTSAAAPVVSDGESSKLTLGLTLPLPRKSSSSLTSLAGLPTLGLKPTSSSTKGKKKTGKKVKSGSKKSVKISNLNDNVESFLDALL